MKILIIGSGAIGRWLAARIHDSGQDVTLLARNETLDALSRDGVKFTDGLTGEQLLAAVKLTDRLGPEDSFDLIVVAMQKSSRLEVCSALAANNNLENVLFVGNDVSGFHRYLDHLPADRVLLGFATVGGGWEDDELVIMDREKPRGPLGEIYIGELDGRTRVRTVRIRELFEAAGIKVHVEKDMDGWLKYHFAFMAPTVGVIREKGGDVRAVARDKETIHKYCSACREAGDVLRSVGYRRRQPPVFNLFYWLPRWLEPFVFSKLFDSRSAEVRIGLHARTIGRELLEMAEEFSSLKKQAGLETPELDVLLAGVRSL